MEKSILISNENMNNICKTILDIGVGTTKKNKQDFVLNRYRCVVCDFHDDFNGRLENISQNLKKLYR